MYAWQANVILLCVTGENGTLFFMLWNHIGVDRNLR